MPASNTNPALSGPSLELGDIYYTLFRHKWKVILCSLAGLAAAVAFYKLRLPPYMSEAKLFIRYVVTEGKSLGPVRDDSIIKTSLDERGDTIAKSELEILTSLDLAEEVARNVGPEKIVGESAKDKNAYAAALVVEKGLIAEVTPNSSVIRIVFSHPDPEVAQQVLREIIDRYLKKHVQVHLAGDLINDAMTQETDQLRAQLSQTEEELRKAMNSAGVISLEDSKKSFGDQITKLRQEIFDAQTELAEQSSILQEVTKGSATAVPADGKESAPPPPEQVAAYKKAVAHLAQLQKKAQDYLAYGFTEESTRVSEIRAQIAATEEEKKKLETDLPALSRLPVTVVTAPNQPTSAYNPANAAAQIAALQAKLKVLTAQLAEVHAEAAKVDKVETTILELRRRRDLQEANYRNLAAGLEQSRINEALGTGRAPNIIQIETPTPARKDMTKIYKVLAGILAAGPALGLAWAFAIELYFDRSVRRGADIERTLRLPLFLSIPKLGRSLRTIPSAREHQPLLGSGGKSPSTTAGGVSSQLALMTGGGELALSPYYETLRDRLISYFDTLNVRHKPKLVAVTGLGKATGITTIAAGLARSFSETGEGNVLLVDMTQGQGSAQHFHKGDAKIGLEQMLETKDSAQVQDNLYVVSENSNSDRLAKGMPQRFSQLIPKLKATDFDYIIFDMPPVNQISITPRLASFMDMMLMVIESEKTDRDIALQASAMLARSKTPVGVVLNKTKSYIPPALHQERDFLLGA